jgi:hypothetical protein
MATDGRTKRADRVVFAGRMIVASKQTVIELLVVALGATELKEMGLDALRAVLRSDPRLAVLDGALDLEPVWEILSAQDDFHPAPATEAICYVKALEPRLGIRLGLPATLADLADVDIMHQAERCKPKREEVDKIIATPTVEEVLTSVQRRRGKRDKKTAWAPTAPKKSLRIPREWIMRVSVLLLAGSVLWIGLYLLMNTSSSPSFKPIDPGFAAGIPVKDPALWATEVHTTLSDATWLSRPPEERKQALAQAMVKLHAQHPTARALVVKDSAHKVRASAQWMDQGPPVVRFY